MGVFVEAVGKMKDSMFEQMESFDASILATIKFEMPVADLVRLHQEAIKFERQNEKQLELIDELRIELTKAKHELEIVHGALDIKTFVHNNLNRDYIKLREENKRLIDSNTSHFRAVCQSNEREIKLRGALEVIQNTTRCFWTDKEHQVKHTHEVACEALKK